MRRTSWPKSLDTERPVSNEPTVTGLPPTETRGRTCLHRLAIQPVQQFSYTTGRTATDSALIIDAMDILHGGRLTASAWSPRTATSPGLRHVLERRG